LRKLGQLIVENFGIVAEDDETFDDPRKVDG